MQVGREAEDLQLALDRGLGRVGDVDDVQRVGLAEGDHVTELPDAAGGINPLTAAEVSHAPDWNEDTALPAQDGEDALDVPGQGRDRPQVDVAVLRHRPLDEQSASQS